MIIFYKKWKPVISFFCVLFLIFAIGNLIDSEVGSKLVTIVVIFTGLLSSIFSERAQEIGAFWSKKILNETHDIIIALSLLIAGALVWIVGSQYKIIKIPKDIKN